MKAAVIQNSEIINPVIFLREKILSFKKDTEKKTHSPIRTTRQ